MAQHKHAAVDRRTPRGAINQIFMPQQLSIQWKGAGGPILFIFLEPLQIEAKIPSCVECVSHHTLHSALFHLITSHKSAAKQNIKTF